MKDDFFVSLGAGMHQIPLIEEAKKIGLRVVGVDINSSALGLGLCDIRIQESITNYRRVLKDLQQFLNQDKIKAVCCAGYGKGIISWAWIAQALKIKGPSVEAVSFTQDKYQTRNFLKEKNIKHPLFAQPPFLSLATRQNKSAVEKLGYPIILKATNDSGKKNIFECPDFPSLKPKLYKKFIKSIQKEPEKMMLEKKIIGDEITVSGIVQNNTFHLVMISDKITSENAPFIELEHRFPSKYKHLEKDMQTLHQELVETLGLNTTPLVSEWKIFKDKCYLIEISPQIPGEFIAEFLIPNALNYNFYKQLVSLALGKKIEKKHRSKYRKAKVVYQPTLMTNKQWEQFTEKSVFKKILNPAASKNLQEITSNGKRFGVVGFVDG